MVGALQNWLFSSGRQDLNLRLLGPKPSALTGLSYAPKKKRSGTLRRPVLLCSIQRIRGFYNCPLCARHHIAASPKFFILCRTPDQKYGMHLLTRNEISNTLTATEPRWKFTASVYLRHHHCLLYRDEHLGVQKQVMTRRNTFLFPPKEREFFFIDGVSTVFHSEERMLRTLDRITSQRSSSSSR